MEDVPVEFGIFGPESMAWRIHRHPSGWVGGVRALLLQALEPRAMAGVAQFSRFGNDTWARFANTSEFIMTVTYRSRQETEQAVANVRGVHVPISGVDPHTQEPFSANDPYLLAYVHNCLVDSLLCAYSELASALTEAEKDRYVKEMMVLADLFGAEMKEVPQTARELSYWISSRSELRLTPEAKLAAGTLMKMNVAPPVQPLWGIVWNTSLALLPKFALDIYGFEVNPIAMVGYKALARQITRTMRLVLPGHSFYREAKYAYYSWYSQNGRSISSKG